MTDTTFVRRQTVVKTDWLQDVNNEVYRYTRNARNFGAVGNGFANDTASLQAWAAGMVSGAVATLPTGAYLVSGYLVFSGLSNFTIDMEGYLIPTGALNDPSRALLQFVNCSNFTVKANIQGPLYGSTLNCIELIGCSDVHIERSLIDVKYNAFDGTAAIQIGPNTSNVWISNNHIRAGYGVLANNPVNVSNIRIFDNEFVGQKSYGSTGTGDAIEANFTSNPGQNWFIERNVFHGYVASNPGAANARIICVGISNVAGLSINDNTFYDSQMEAIHLENGCSKFTICNNKINDGVIGINLNTNSNLNQGDGVISDNEINLPAMAPVFAAIGVDYGAAILVNVNTVGIGYAYDLVITGNKCAGTTGAARGICVYDGNQFVLANNHVHNFPRAGFDLRPFPGSTAAVAGPQDAIILGNKAKSNGWGFILGGLTSGGAFTNAGPMPEVIFDRNDADNSLFGLDFNSEITTRTGSLIRIPYRDVSVKYSAGDVLYTSGQRGQSPDIPVITSGITGAWQANDGEVAYSKSGSGTAASIGITFSANASSGVLSVVEITAMGVAANGTSPEMIIARYLVPHQASVGAISHVGADVISGTPTISTAVSGLTATFTANFTSGFNNSIRARVTQGDAHRISTGGVSSFA